MNVRIILVVILILYAVPTPSSATRLTERWITVNPLGVETPSRPGDIRGLETAGFWGEFANYRIETDEDHAYNVKIGGFFELVRSGQDWSLAFLASTELVASRRDELFFRPNATFWEEGFLFTKRAGRRYWQLAYMHRCKHDVDNLGTDHCDGVGCERSLIYGSLQGKLLIPFDVGRKRTPRSTLILHGDLFTLLMDDRKPSSLSDRLPNLERALGAVGANLHLRRPLRQEWLGAYLTAHGSVQLFGEQDGFLSRFSGLDRITGQAGITGGVALQGAMHLRFGIAYEYLEDTGINPDPDSSHLISLSVSVLDSNSIW